MRRRELVEDKARTLAPALPLVVRSVSVALTLLFAVFVSGCTKSCSQKENTATSRVRGAVPIRASEVAQKAPPLPPPDTYAEAIRRRDYATAAQLIDKSPAEERSLPEVRLARAHVALALDDVGTALNEVTGLDEAFADFAPLVRDTILVAAKKTQDVTVLEHLLGTEGRTGASADRLALLEAYEAEGQVEKALTGLGEMIESLRQIKRRSKSENELLARVTQKRAVLLETLHKPEAAALDYRWLAIEAPTSPEARSADQKDELLSHRQLTRTERLARAKAFGERGNLAAAEEELQRLKAAPGPAPDPGEVREALAWAVFSSRSNYPRAAKLFHEAADLAPKERAHHLYYSAKSLARAHQHQQAIVQYRMVEKLGGIYSDHANYNAAHLSYIDGDFPTALRGYEAYLRQHSQGAHAESARYEQAIAHLAHRDLARARRDLRRLLLRSKSEREKARLLELEGVAALGQGDSEPARMLFNQVIDDRPLSLASGLAAARLEQAALPVPPALLPLPASQQTAAPALDPPLPDLVRRLDRVGLDVQAEQALRDREGELRQLYGERGLEALCQLYGKLALATRRYQVAQTAATWSTLSHEPTSTNRWQWQCIYPTPHEDAVRREANARGVSPAFVYAIMRQESAFRPLVESPARAVGLMQIIPTTAAQIAAELGDEYDPSKMLVPDVNIRYGVHYLRRLLDMFGDRPELVAAAYNAGPHAVESWLKGGETLPLDVFVAKIPYGETREYVYRVMGNLARYEYLLRRAPPRIDLSLPSGLRAEDGAY